MILRQALLAVTAFMGAVAGAPASAYSLVQSYTVSSLYDLHHIASFNNYASGSGLTTSYNLNAPGGVLTDPFYKDSANPPLFTYFLGTSNLSRSTAAAAASSVAAQDGHLVVALNSTYASQLLLGGADFSTTFAGFNENSLIKALTLLDVRAGATQTAIDQAANLVVNFSQQVSSQGGLAAANGGSLTLLSFSSPTLAGSAVTSLSPAPGAVPEPASWALMLGGFGAIGVAMRQRRRTTVSFGYRTLT